MRPGFPQPKARHNYERTQKERLLAVQRQGACVLHPISKENHPMNVKQLCFNFNIIPPCPSKADPRVSWRVRALAHRHNLPISQAAFIAVEMRLPIGGLR